MSNDDSFQDSDEMFSLYSSKKVMDTFKAQLKKIAAENHLRKPYSCVNNEEFSLKQDEKKDVSTNDKQENSLVECIEILNDDSTHDKTTNNSTEDSIEVITEFIPRRSGRRSERLRARQMNCQLSWSSLLSDHSSEIQGRRRGRKGRKQKQGKQIQEITLDDSPRITETDDELNPELSVKVIWKSANVKRFQIRKFQKLSCIFEQLSKEENIPEEKVILTFNNIRVSKNDTPDSLNLQVYHFLDGGVLSELSNFSQTPDTQKSNADCDSVTLKFQDVNKKIIKLSLHKNEKLKVAMIKYSEQSEIPLSRIKFFFDGELLKPSETPATLGVEDEEIIDIKITDCE